MNKLNRVTTASPSSVFACLAFAALSTMSVVGHAASTSCAASYPSSPLVNETFTATMSLTTTGSGPGYAPAIEIFTPAGVTVSSGTTAFGAVTVSSADITGVAYTHPVTGVDEIAPVTSPAVAKIFVLRLPLSSAVSSLGTVPVTVSFALSAAAVAGTTLTLPTRCLFVFGQNALNDPTTDNPDTTRSVASGTTVTPAVIRVNKRLLTASHTAPGPHYPVLFAVDVDVAVGTTVTNVDVRDVLSNSFQYSDVLALTGVVLSPASPPPVPGGVVALRYNTIVGATGVDATFVVSGYLPDRDAFGTSINYGLASGNTLTSNAVLDNYTIGASTFTPAAPSNSVSVTGHSLLVREQIASSPVIPGEQVIFTQRIEVSDYSSFAGPLGFRSVLGAGLLFDAGGVGGQDAVLTCPSGTTNLSALVTTAAGPSVLGASEGDVQLMDFSVLPGLVGNNSFAGAQPPYSPVGTATVCDLTFRATVQQTYQNGATVRGSDVIETRHTLSSTSPALVTNENDSGSGGSVSVRAITIEKQLVRLERSGVPQALPAALRTGDVATWRLFVSNLSGDSNGISLTDYFPSPIFEANEYGALNAQTPNGSGEFASLAAPVRSIRICQGAGNPSAECVVGTSAGINQSLIELTSSPGSINNSMVFSVAPFTSTATQTLEVLVDLTVTAEPVDDSLQFTNVATASIVGTSSFTSSSTQSASFILHEPALFITKGAIASTAAAVFSPSAQALLPPYTSSDLRSIPVQADVSGVDAQDEVTFAIVLENRGNAPAFRATLRDRTDLVAALEVIGSGTQSVNLSVTRGDGVTAEAFTGASLFDTNGIELTNPIPACASFNGAGQCIDNTGNNLRIVRFTVKVRDTIGARVTLPTTLTYAGELTRFQSQSVGPNFIGDPRADGTTVTTRDGTSLTGTVLAIESGAGVPSASTSLAAINDVVTYRFTGSVPEGRHQNFTATATLPANLAWIGAPTLTLGSNVSSTTNSCTVNATTITCSLGTVTTSANGSINGVRSFTIDAKAVLLNNSGFVRGNTVAPSAASLSFANGSTNCTALAPCTTVGVLPAAVTLIEPTLNVNTLSVTPSTGVDSGDSLTFNVRIPHSGASNSPAHDIAFSLNLGTLYTGVTAPAGFTGCTGASAGSVSTDVSGNTIVSATCSLKNTGSGNWDFSFTGNVAPGTLPLGQSQTYAPLLTWTSQAGPSVNVSSFTTADTERDGSASPAQNNYRATTPNLTVNFRNGAVTNAFLSSDSGSANVRIGDRVVYRASVIIPEGARTISLVDTLPTGLTFERADFVSNVIAGGTLTCGATDCSDRLTGTTGSPATITTSGQVTTFALGTVTNSNTNNGAGITGTLTFDITARVANVAANTAGTTRATSLTFNGIAATAAVSGNVTIVEPNLTVSVVGAGLGLSSTGPFDAGDTVNYTVSVANSAAANTSIAYDAALRLTIPTGLRVTGVTPLSGSCTIAGVPGAPTDFPTTNPQLTSTFITVLDQVAPGDTCVMRLSLVLTDALPVGTSLTVANGSVTYTSLAAPTYGSPLVSPRCIAHSASPTECLNSPERAGDGAVNNYLRTLAGFSLNTRAQTLTKTMTSLVNRTIGNDVTFQVVATIPEGSPTTLTVLDTLPTGLSYVAGQAINYVGSDPKLAFTAPVNPTVSGQNVTWNFTSVRNCNDDVAPADDCVNGANDQTITFTFLARVGNVAANQAELAALSNNQIQLNAGALTAAANTSVNVIEPTLTLSTNTSASTGDAGDLVTVTHVITNNGGATDPAVAYNVRLLQDYGTRMTPQALPAVTFSANCGGTTGAAINARQITLDVQSIALGQSCSISYQYAVDANVIAGQAVSSAASALTWTTLDDGCFNNTGGACPTSAERNGTTSPAVNDLRVVAPTITFTVDAFSVAHSMLTPRPRAVSDTVTYLARVTVPESQSPLSWADALPPGLRYVSATIANNSNASMTCAGLSCVTGANLSVTPTGSSTTGQNAVFNFGVVTNPGDNSVGPDFFELQITAAVDNISDNQSPRTLAKNSLSLNGGAAVVNDALDAAAIVTVTEPALTRSITLNPNTNIDAGDIVRVSLALSHTGASTSDAYDVRIRHTLPADLVGQPASLSGTGCGTLSGPGVSATSVDITLDAFALAAGTCTIAFDVEVSSTATPNTTYASSASSLTWTSRQGVVVGERTGVDGTGGLNDYSAAIGFSVTTGTAVNFAKTLVSSSDVANTTIAQIAMGETATYRLDVTLNEGTNNNVVVVDTPPLGMRITDVSIVSTGFAGTVPPLSAPSLGGSGAPVTINLGTVLVTSDNVPSNNTFGVLVTAVAEWNAGLVPLSAALNAATLSVAGSPVGSTSTPVEFVLPEPVLALTLSNLTPKAGDPSVEWSALLSNTGNGPVCDTTLVFAMPGGMTPIAPASDGIDNDGDGLVDGADFTGEGVVSGQSVSVPVVGCLAGGSALPAFRVLGAVDANIPFTPSVGTVTLGNYRTLLAPAGELLDPEFDLVDTNIDGSVDEPNDAASEEAITPQAPRLTFTKTVNDISGDPALTVPLDFVSYTLTVTNTGNRAATELELSDVLPSDLIGVASSVTVLTTPASAATASLSGSTLTANLLDLPAAGSAVVTITARVRSDVAGGSTISNIAVLETSDAYDPADATVSFTVSGNDTDGDGLDDDEEVVLGTSPTDADSDDDGVADGAEQPGDADNDGVPNALDADSDNDGLFDGLELGRIAAVADPDAAGPLLGTDLGAGFFSPDTDAGSTTDPYDSDTDNGGVSDGNEDLNRDGASAGETDPNVQADDLAGSAVDSDSDGRTDSEELAAGTNPQDSDSDDDGVLDGNEASWNIDSDGDGLINALDVDSDNDGLFDATEIGLTVAQAPEDPFALATIRGTDLTKGYFVADLDSATRTNPLRADTDQGGVRDGSEDTNHNGRIDAGELDPRDPNDDLSVVSDDDGDGLPNAEEIAAGTDPQDLDTDDDGVRDGDEPNWNVDSDGDSLVNALDPDSDNDRLFDGTERSVTVAVADPDGAGPLRGTDLAAGHFIADAQPLSSTNMLLKDSDRGGMNDGLEDANHNGDIDTGERDPQAPLDDTDFTTFPVVDTDGDGVSDADEGTAGTDPNDADTDDDGVRDGDEPLWNEDSDSDGTINARDPDSDNDGVFDGTELGLMSPVSDPDGSGPLTGTRAGSPFYIADADPLTRTPPLLADTDGGGVSDGKEDVNRNGRVDAPETDPRVGSDDTTPPDTDGDGLSDAQETTFGTNPNDADSDDDGVTDGAEQYWNVDSDADGLINALDPDSDNDGLYDGTERGFDCANSATNLTARHCVADANPSSTTDPLDADSDNGGINDGFEDFNLDGAVDTGEGDPNIAPDTLATDTDGDGLPDALEQFIGTDENDADSDDDGVLDGAEPNLRDDTDGDGLINARDPDSDNDGLFDGTELGLDCANPATSLAARHCIADADNNSTTSALDRDTDNGGVSDGVEDANRNGAVDGTETNPLDPSDDSDLVNQDSDGDGLSDVHETSIGTRPDDADSDDDGVLDGAEPNYSDDTDSDGLINALDPDSDNDGLFDGTELGLNCSNPATSAANNTCVPDADAGATKTSPVDADSDRGGVSDGTEDTNKNGQLDASESDPNVAPDTTPLDTDGDGLSDAEENFFGTDFDDADSDDDGVIDGQEPNWRIDSDGDGLVNALDPDSDNDGLYDGTELGLDCANPATSLAAGHCIADADAARTSPLDRDTDNGGASDGLEDINKNGAIDSGETDPNDPADDAAAPVDTDGDGLSDDDEQRAGTAADDQDSDDDGVLDGAEPNWQSDTDGDGLINALDPDSDNDGLYDGTELGFNCSNPATDVTKRHCIADADLGTTRTSALVADTDGGGVEDGSEDTNRNGVVDGVEADPRSAPDATLVDSDNDGVSDAQEVLLHTDPNDADSDDDGIVDGLEPNYQDDTDGDGLINALDPDSDNDGLFDGTESGRDCSLPATDPAAANCVADADAGATKTGVLSKDTDRGGVSDGSEDTNKDGAFTSPETDPNLLSDDAGVVDSDNDGLSDATETAAGTDPNDADSDDDGLLDGAEDNWRDDTDGDGLINARDPDSDNDGLFDGTERGQNCASPATDASANTCVADAEPATTTSMLLKDTDYGGVPDGIEDQDRNGRVDAGESNPNSSLDDVLLEDTDGDTIPDVVEGIGDTDGDGVPDFLDPDSDNDGISDLIEAGDANLTTVPLDTDLDGVPDYRDLDSDQDSIPDSVERGATATPVDSDADSTPDYRDLDSDSDGMSDQFEAGDSDVTTAPVDSDEDGIADYFDPDSDNDTITDREEGDVDTDDDNTRDSLDLDSDNDGLNDADEAGDALLASAAIDSDGDGVGNFRDTDSDNDGVLDATDNCPLVSNPNQIDSDGDGTGDACTDDADGDGILDAADNCRTTVNADQRDTDGDGIGDACAADVDGDGIPDLRDNCALQANTDQADKDRDGLGDLCDPDIDGDGFLNGVGVAGGVGGGCASTQADVAWLACALMLIAQALRRRIRS